MLNTIISFLFFTCLACGVLYFIIWLSEERELDKEIQAGREKKQADKMRWRTECKTCRFCDIGHRAINSHFENHDSLDETHFVFYCARCGLTRRLDHPSCPEVTGEARDLFLSFANLNNNNTES